MIQRQAHAQYARSRRADTVEDTTAAPEKGTLEADIDALLDEIDDVLETNAEEFVRGFIQKGGE